MRVIVVEDEPLAREGLSALLAAEPAVEVVGSFASAAAARHALRTSAPDAMFVDVEMPGESGVELVRSIPQATRPKVVFVTAHETYAATAFDVEAVDYVLKPIDETRLSVAVGRVRRSIETSALASTARSIVEVPDAPGDTRRLTRISARVGERLVVMKLCDVSWIEADGDYMKVHSRGRALFVRMTMRELERRLDPDMFVRVHRSALVNIDAVTGVEMLPHGDHVTVLTDGSRVRVGRSYRDALFETLGERA